MYIRFKNITTYLIFKYISKFFTKDSTITVVFLQAGKDWRKWETEQSFSRKICKLKIKPPFYLDLHLKTFKY